MGQILASLASLTAMEIVLGIDNVVFISILASKLPDAQRGTARKLGLAVALATRLLLLLSVSWLMGLTAPLFSILGKELSGRDLILLAGGLFLIAKATHEIFDRLEGPELAQQGQAKAASFTGVIAQIAVLDIVFSLDSVITAVGMAQQLWVMVVAMVVAVGVMLAASGGISRFVERHPSVKMLALSFLLLIGVMLVGEAIDHHIAKGYVYFAMGFSLFVEVLNLRLRKVHAKPVELHHRAPLGPPSASEK
jgi:predicted tellurium resistance membrane protein TerC